MAKIVLPLTDTQPRNAKPKGKPYRLTDGRGLYLLVSKEGSKYWRMDYRFLDKRKTLAFGKYPDISLGDARKKCTEARALIQKGIDPGENKKAQKAAKKEAAVNSFEVIAREWLINKSNNLTPRTAKNMTWMLETNVFPWIGGMPISELKTQDFLKVLKRIEEKDLLDTLRKVRGYCSQIMRYATETGRAESDPVIFSKSAFKTPKTRHMAAITDPRQVAELLRMIDSYTGTFPVACALKIAPYVFVRPGELRQAKWADINFDTAEWRYTVTKTRTEHIVPLAGQVITILKGLHPLTGSGMYLFPSERTKERPMSDNTINAALRRLGVSKEEMTGHGFRAMARTILDEVLGERVDLIEHQLAHAVKDPNGRAYNRTAHLPERKRMMQRWADYLDSLKKSNVIPLDKHVAEENTIMTSKKRSPLNYYPLEKAANYLSEETKKLNYN